MSAAVLPASFTKGATALSEIMISGLKSLMSSVRSASSCSLMPSRSGTSLNQLAVRTSAGDLSFIMSASERASTCWCMIRTLFPVKSCSVVEFVRAISKSSFAPGKPIS